MPGLLSFRPWILMFQTRERRIYRLNACLVGIKLTKFSPANFPRWRSLQPVRPEMLKPALRQSRDGRSRE